MLLNIAQGRLTRDPELRQVNIGGNQVSVCEFSVAVNVGFGENQQTEFIDCVAWRGKADTIAKFFTKGRMILVQGGQKTSKFTDSNGVERRKTEWVISDFSFCDSASGGNNGGGQQANNSQPTQQPAANPYMATNQFYEMAGGAQGGSGAPF